MANFFSTMHRILFFLLFLAIWTYSAYWLTREALKTPCPLTGTPVAEGTFFLMLALAGMFFPLLLFATVAYFAAIIIMPALMLVILVGSFCTGLRRFMCVYSAVSKHNLIPNQGLRDFVLDPFPTKVLGESNEPGKATTSK